MIEALKACYDAGYCHRDLKPDNLLFDWDYQLKLADFGFATSINGEFGDGKLYDLLGTRSYFAPEIWEARPYEGMYVDLFSAGCILFIMQAGHPAFEFARQDDPWFKMIKEKVF